MRKKAIILGMDGLDHRMLAAMMGQGELPHFSKLAAAGCFTPLATANPPQSPVAWASIATGNNPGKHGLFDFLIRNPKNYLPDLGVLRQSHSTMTSLGSPAFEPVLGCEPFWETLARQDIGATVLKWPVTFPPTGSSATVLAGLGVPDVKGGLGRYTFFTSQPGAGSGRQGQGTVTPVRFENGRAACSITGPLVGGLSGSRESAISLDIIAEPGSNSIALKVQDQTIALGAGQWSPWVRLKFKAGLLKSVRGMCRFLLESAQPHLSLYMSPLHIDPAKPCFPISSPQSYAPDLEGRFGPYHTLGIPEDTNAVVDGRMGRQAFVQSCDAIVREQENVFFHELENFRQGLLACVFFTTDRIQHIFWAGGDKTHPAYDPGEAQAQFQVILDYYRKMDRILGRVLDRTDEDALLMVCSDHGFTSFKKSVHLNTWLARNGFMTLTRTPGPADKEGGPLFQYVDWDKTRAYALGLGSIYLNMAGREGSGIVTPDQAPALMQEIASRMEQWTDQETGENVVRSVYSSQALYQGPFAGEAPDMVVGFAEGYRMSWQTAVGGAPFKMLEPNTTAWTGDHCMDPSLVPGVFLSNKKFQAGLPHCTDVAPTVLHYFGLPHNTMDGRSML